MPKPALNPAAVLLGILVVGTLLPAIADEEDQLDHMEARQLMKQGAILPLQTILKKVQGRILEVELEYEHNRYLYEIEVLNANGIVIELEFDATTGKLIKSEIED